VNAADELQRRLHQAIPLSAAMACRISVLAEREIRLEAPLAANVNVHGTGFAGSLYGLGILAAWGLCAHLIEGAGLDAELVVADAAIRYREPVRADIVCTCAVEAATAASFVQELARRGRAEVRVTVEIGAGGGARPAARLDARMHARRET
jgi:thioesterase domain-containing protein